MEDGPRAVPLIAHAVVAFSFLLVWASSESRISFGCLGDFCGSSAWVLGEAKIKVACGFMGRGKKSCLGYMPLEGGFGCSGGEMSWSGGDGMGGVCEEVCFLWIIRRAVPSGHDGCLCQLFFWWGRPGEMSAEAGRDTLMWCFQTLCRYCASLEINTVISTSAQVVITTCRLPRICIFEWSSAHGSWCCCDMSALWMRR